MFIIINVKNDKDLNLSEIIFCNIINVFTVTFDQFNVSLLNKSLFRSFLTRNVEWFCIMVSTKIWSSTTVIIIDNNGAKNSVLTSQE